MTHLRTEPEAAMKRNRVSAACDRCRRQKQRCDDFRPCSNCVHARMPHTCSTTQSNPPADAELEQPFKRQRTTSNHHSESSGMAQSPGPHQTRSLLHRSSPTSSQRQTEHHAQNSFSRSDRGPWQAEQPPTRNESPGMGTMQAESAIDMTRRLFRDGSPSSPFSSRATFAIPGGESEHQGRTSTVQVSVQDLVGIDLPHQALCNSLLDTYFATVHWFSLVVLEPKFRARCKTVVNSGLVHQSDRAFIILLLMVLVMGCWYDASPELATLQKSFLRVVRSHFMDIIDEDSLEFVQVSALLGSFYLYHGRPRSSFSILGAATKTSQAIGLHREPDGRLDASDAEERKRVWWSIYTWDRFATIIYGRPLGINDKDCNVSMPAEIYENMSSRQSDSDEAICLSTYQTQLNHIYRIASPVLENIYGIRSSTDLGLHSRLPDMIKNATRSLEQWKQALPTHLSYDLITDITDTSLTREKMHALQALSLQLTYDNIMIVLHRTLLADQRQITTNGVGEHRQQSSQRPSLSPYQEFSSNPEDNNFERCLAAALSISRTQSKPKLIALAQNTHLVSFLAMNLFTSSVVMSICALSDTMSDIAQEAKRGMSRTLHLLKKLSTRASLPMQCSTILEDLVGLILKREKAAMLFGLEEGLGTSLRRREGQVYPQQHDPDPKSDLSAHLGEASGRDQDQSFLPPSSRAQTAYRSRAGSYAHPQAQTIFDLQRIFEENSVPKPQGLPPSFSYEDVDNNGSGNYNNTSSAGFGFLGSSNATSDELGQFWLWNMEPFQEDLLHMPAQGEGKNG